MISSLHADNGSFRDPAGFVFFKGDRVLRAVSKAGVPGYEAARDSSIYDLLIRDGLLLPHRELESGAVVVDGADYILEQPRLPMVSYPWEWPFSMLKDAALLHLYIMEKIVPEGFWLRDANAYNAQFDGKTLRIIDTLSIGVRPPDTPWVGYGQFCSNFLAPLCLAAYSDIKTMGLWRTFINGFPLDLTRRLLPIRALLKPGIFMHIAMHSYFQQRSEQRENLELSPAPKAATMSERALVSLIRSLRHTVEKITWQSKSPIWTDYAALRTYEKDDLRRKSGFVEEIIGFVNPGLVWDLGSNTGEYSLLAAAKGAFVVSVDSDPACTESLYKKITRGPSAKRILPLHMDLSNPSSPLGWAGKERKSLAERGPADLTLALALIHHLVFSCLVPLPKVAEWFSEITRHLVIEFVPIEDPMVRVLLKDRNNEFHPYSEELFKSSFQEYFTIAREQRLNNGRTLFHLEPR